MGAGEGDGEIQYLELVILGVDGDFKERLEETLDDVLEAVNVVVSSVNVEVETNNNVISLSIITCRYRTVWGPGSSTGCARSGHCWTLKVIQVIKVTHESN